MNAPASNLPWSEQYRLAAMAWVDADAAASILEDTKSCILSEKMQAHADKPTNKAEILVKSSPEWRAHVMRIVEARRKANQLKVTMEFYRMKFSEWQSHEATKRAESRL
jgi:hypothetical protein